MQGSNALREEEVNVLLDQTKAILQAAASMFGKGNIREMTVITPKVLYS